MQICRRGHIITTNYDDHPELRERYCGICGSETITNCQNCDAFIKGEYLIPGVLTADSNASVKNNCYQCGKEYPWFREKKNANKVELKVAGVIEQSDDVEISIVSRMAIMDYLRINSIDYSGKLNEPDFLIRLYDLKNLPSKDYRFTNAYDDIEKHTVYNTDWEVDWLFTDSRINLLHSSNDQFSKFIELMFSPVTRDDSDSKRELIRDFNSILKKEDIEIYESGQIAGRPSFSLRELNGRENYEYGGSDLKRRLALVVGCNDYQYSSKLQNAVNDASVFESSLESLGFNVIKVIDPTYRELIEAVDSFGEEVDNYDIALFFFAGHGMQVKGVNYLIPIDADIKSERTIKFDCLNVNRILAHMEDRESKVNVVILDACRDNPFERKLGRSVDNRGLAPVDAPSGSIIGYATAPGKYASDGTGENGIYTESLVEYLNVQGLTLIQVFQNTRKMVIDKSKGDQTPWESTSLTEDLYLNK